MTYLTVIILITVVNKNSSPFKIICVVKTNTVVFLFLARSILSGDVAKAANLVSQAARQAISKISFRSCSWPMSRAFDTHAEDPSSRTKKGLSRRDRIKG